MSGDCRYEHPPQFAGRYQACVLDHDGNCSRWNHDHAPAVPNAYFAALDGENEPTIWESHPGDDPIALVRQSDLPHAHRERLWAALTLGFATLAATAAGPA